MPTLTANGIRIAFDTAGDAKSTPVLLVHGLGMQLTNWPDEFVDGLVELGFYVIRFDNRDCGLSTKFDRAGKPSLAWSWIKSRLGLPFKPPSASRRWPRMPWACCPRSGSPAPTWSASRWAG